MFSLTGRSIAALVGAVVALGNLGAAPPPRDPPGCIDIVPRHENVEGHSVVRYIADSTTTPKNRGLLLPDTPLDDDADPDDPTDLDNSDGTTTYSGGRLEGDIVLDAPSCGWADYELTVYRWSNKEELLTLDIGQRHTQSLSIHAAVPDYDEKCVLLVATASGRGFEDRAPDEDGIFNQACDGDDAPGQTWN